jgi:hypothetical protein
MSMRRSLAMTWMLAAFGVMLWGWISYAGPFRWAAEWQLEHFGSYQVKLTLFVPLMVLLIPVGLIGGWGPLASRRPITREQRTVNARRNARVMTVLGLVALAIGATAGGLGYQRMQRPLTQATLALVTGDETAPAADLVSVDAMARTDMIVGLEETVAGTKRHSRFVPLVAATWRPGEPIRFLLRTNQDAWIPPAGFPGPREMRLLRAGNPPFRMITQPSVLAWHDLPGVVRAEYEKARVPLAVRLAVVEQSESEVFAPYWMAAAGGGVVGLCLVLSGVIGGINARKAAAA